MRFTHVESVVKWGIQTEIDKLEDQTQVIRDSQLDSRHILKNKSYYGSMFEANNNLK